MADWTTPKTWAVGDVLTASDMNTYVRDNQPLFYWVTSTFTNSNNNSEVDMLQNQITVPANALGTNRRMIAWLSGDVYNLTGSSKTNMWYRVKLGATTALDTGTVGGGGIPNSPNRGMWTFTVTCQSKNSANAQEWTIDGNLLVGTKVNFTTGVGARDNQGEQIFGRNETAIVTTTALVFAFTTNNGTASANLNQKLYAAKIAIGV